MLEANRFGGRRHYLTCMMLDLFCWDVCSSLRFVPLVACISLWRTAPAVFTYCIAFAHPFIWVLLQLVVANYLIHSRVPLQNKLYSVIFLRWTFWERVRPATTCFPTRGTRWHAVLCRMQLYKIGKRFFSIVEDLGPDPQFTRLGDDVTIDYDGRLRCHSFENRLLKFSPVVVGSGVSLMQRSLVAMSDVGDHVILSPGTVTWKGETLKTGLLYEGAPARVCPVQPYNDRRQNKH